jgi:hypothetical protein
VTRPDDQADTRLSSADEEAATPLDRLRQALAENPATPSSELARLTGMSASWCRGKRKVILETV